MAQPLRDQPAAPSASLTALRTMVLGASRIPLTASATVGRAIWMSLSTARHLVVGTSRLSLPLGETIQQAWSLFAVTAFPAALMAIPFGAMISIQAGGMLHQVGATSRVGAAAGMGILRQGAPMAAALLMAGAAGSVITSDLGTRAIREEIDAMRTIGVDPIQRLVVPRLLAMLVIAPMLLAAIILVGVGSAFAVAVAASGVSGGSFWQSFGGFASTTDLIFALLKVLVGAVLVTIIASLRGLEAKGGPRGVADAVNAAVVLSVAATVFAGLVLTQLQTMFFPEQFA